MTNDPAGRQPGIGRLALAASTGNLLSNLTGLGRNVSLAAAIGTGLVADAYNIANQVPYQTFMLLGGGTFVVVLVPELVRHARESISKANEYGSLLLLAGAVFGALSVALILAISPSLVSLMGGASWGDDQRSLSLHFAVWCIPQLFFYALFSVASQIMNSRGLFNVAAFVPIANNLVIIGGCIPLILLGLIEVNSPGSVGSREITLLGGATLLGAALQSILLIVLLFKSGFRFRLRRSIRGLGLRSAGRNGLLTLGVVVLHQALNLVAAALTTQAGTSAKILGYNGRGYTAFFYAQTMMLVVQAVASMGIANVLLQRLSKHYAEGDDETARKELNEAMLAVGALLVPAAALLLCVGPLITELVFTRGETGYEEARFIGVVLAVLSISLLPYALHEFLVRPFYALQDAVTPLRSALLISTVSVLGAFVASWTLSSEYIVLGIAAAFGAAYTIDIPLRFRALKKKLNFRLAPTVVEGYRMALLAALVASLVVGAGLVLAEQHVDHQFSARLVLLIGAIGIFMAIYLPLTARTPASLRLLVEWLK